MTYVVTGQTFRIASALKNWGGRFFAESKRWEFDYLSSTKVAYLRGIPGVMVSEPAGAQILATRPAKPRAIRTGKTQVYGDDDAHLGLFADEDPIAFFGFSSLAALCDHVEGLTRPPNANGTCDVAWSTDMDRIKATATKDMSEALDLARNGWTEGFGLASKFDIPHATNKRRTHGLAGGTVNVGRMLAGNPAHMVRRVQAPKNKRITLFVETMMWQGITPENAMLRAIIIAGVIDLMETQGYACAIYAVGCSRSFHDMKAQAQISVNIKEAGERLSLLDISFALGHPSFLRRLFFACEGVIPEIAMQRDERGIVSDVFTKEHQPPSNCYFFDKLPSHVDQRLYLDPMSMLAHILPSDLPIEIKGLT